MFAPAPRPTSFLRTPAVWLATGALLITRAASGQAGALTLDRAVAEALQHNADVRLARLRVDSAHGELRIARALPGVTAASAPQSPWQYSLSLPVDAGPSRYFRTQVASRGMAAAAEDTVAARADALFAVRQAFHDALLTEKVRDVARDERDLLKRVLAADSARLCAGDVPERDVTKAELELARAEASLTRADAQVHATRIALQVMMGRTVLDTGLAVRGDDSYRDIDIPRGVTDGAAYRRPEVRAALERLRQSDAASKLATAQLVPVPTAGVVYQGGSPFPNGSTYALAIGAQLPLLYWFGGERERSRAGLEASRVNASRTELQVAADVSTSLDAYHQARSLAARYDGGLVTRAARSLESARYAYQAGAASFLELVEAIRTDGAVRVDQATARHDYWIAVYALSRATGVELAP